MARQRKMNSMHSRGVRLNFISWTGKIGLWSHDSPNQLNCFTESSPNWVDAIYPSYRRVLPLFWRVVPKSPLPSQPAIERLRNRWPAHKYPRRLPFPVIRWCGRCATGRRRGGRLRLRRAPPKIAVISRLGWGECRHRSAPRAHPTRTRR